MLINILNGLGKKPKKKELKISIPQTETAPTPNEADIEESDNVQRCQMPNCQNEAVTKC